MRRREFLKNGISSSLASFGLLTGTCFATAGMFDRSPGNIIKGDVSNPVEYPNPESSALETAIRLGQVDTVKHLIRQGMDVNTKFQDDLTPLHWACRLSALEYIKRMHYFDPELETRKEEELYGKRIDHPEAIDYGKSIEVLDDAGIDWRLQTKHDGSPFHLEAREVRQKIVRFLIDAGADLEARDWINRTPLHHAACASDISILQYLFDIGVNQEAKDVDGRNYLFYVFARSGFETLRYLMKSGIDLNVRDINGGSLIHVAAMNFDVRLLKYLVDLGYDAFSKADKFKECCPIHSASEYGCLDTVRYLIGLGIDVQTKGQGGNTPLHLACHPRIAEFLINSGTDINAQNDQNITPLHKAMLYGKTEMANYLITKGADANNFTFDSFFVLTTSSKNTAVGIEFDPLNVDVPRVAAKGDDDWIVRKMFEVAVKNDIHIINAAPTLLQDIYDNFNVGETIPERHYESFAEMCAREMKNRGLFI